MSDLRLELHECATSSSVVVALCLRGWNELFAKGLSDGRLAFHGQMSAFVAHAANGRDELPVGVLLFGLEPEYKRAWVTLSYVMEEFRGRGIYSAMWAGLVAESTKQNISTIESATHIRNSAMRAVAQRQGRIEEFVILVARLK